MFLLHLDSSAHRAGESTTRQLTGLFARHWLAGHRDAGYRYRDLAAEPVAPIGEAYCDLGRRVERHGTAFAGEQLIRTAAERREWNWTRELADEVLACDVLLLGAPMYNYSAPAALKAWIDRVSFPGVFHGPGGAPLLAGLRVVVVTACGGAYGPGTNAESRDFLTPYLRSYFVKQGVPAVNIEIVTADLTLAWLVPGREPQQPAAAAAFAAAQDRLIQLAESR
ncbi:FMN-dependent NADH-azoreductase [Amycolatopsis albispora]|uniref:FMN-dependent NADH-azoreductase n=1 Tax=Amycolatopsis albispora TaxID=1804986 RepID=UPI001F3D0536|nr:NAD(P)H-dependent oxidoreductase [Amycolatopsis albispora]